MMNTTFPSVRRIGPTLHPDQSRVLLRPFVPGDAHRVERIISRVMAMPEHEVDELLHAVTAEFSERHERVTDSFRARFEQLQAYMPTHGRVSESRRQLIGSYFLAEYSLESAALFNPSVVPHPDQSRLPSGALRILLSLRATGEGHISSITFRSGVVHANGSVEIFEPADFLSEPRQIPNPVYEKPLFERKLAELGLDGEFTRRVIAALRETFTPAELRTALMTEEGHHKDNPAQEDMRCARGIWLLARSNYEVQFQPDQELSSRILFPATPSQSNGVEDARFVRFRDDDDSYIYYATFTAFDGRLAVPELVETTDFLHFRFLTLNGPAAENKGMAVFPRKIAGRYAMLSRQDNENMYLMFSDNVHFWNERHLLLKPEYSWELIQLGNCGSPIETEAGWLVLTHGVGPMRRYCLSAILLDLNDPCRVIGRLRMPLLQPSAEEREGYVPNVVYSCGGLVHNGQLIIPYGLADHATSFASVPLSDVLESMHRDEV